VPGLISPPPPTAIEPVTDVLHGVPVTDPYRWLEDQNSPRTRAWIEEQTAYARSYLDNIPGRERIRRRVRELLATETYDSLQKVGRRYFFRKRLAEQEQPCIYLREGLTGKDELLIDPSTLGKGKYTAVKPLKVSTNGKVLLYEIKQGGERTGSFALLDVDRRRTLPDILPRGYLRGFAFASDGQSFYYVHEPLSETSPSHRAARQHILGTPFAEDESIFCARGSHKLRLSMAADETRFGFLVCDFDGEIRTDFYLKAFERDSAVERVFSSATYSFGPRLIHGRILAITNREAPNLRIVELRRNADTMFEWIDIVPEQEGRIRQWTVTRDHVLVSYIYQSETRVWIFDLGGGRKTEWPRQPTKETIRLIGATYDEDEIIVASESFTEPPATMLFSVGSKQLTLWSKQPTPFDSEGYIHSQVWYASKDGARIPMFLVGRPDILAGGCHPVILTSYGGHGVSMTPQFSVFVAFLLERGFLFALPNIRGGSEFGSEWHRAAKRHRRQTAYDDFLAAAEWLVATGRTTPRRLAIFGGSNSGLLVGAALTQRPDLFRAVVCMVPLLDMLRYHLFDDAHVWRDEFGIASEPEDFPALASYSPYHHVERGGYPALLLVSGDADQKCNPLHARKMTARLQAANTSTNPILLDYRTFRGHSPVLPLTERVEGLTDRLAFLCDQLQLSFRQEEV